jgi:hypothetical protein
MNEVAAPVVMALSKADTPTREQIKRDVFALIKQQYQNKPALEYGAVVVCGQKQDAGV